MSPLRSLLTLLVLIGSSMLAAAAPAGLQIRARILALEPEEPARIFWRHGGEGLGGTVQSGELTAVLMSAHIAEDNSDEITLDEQGKQADRIIEEDDRAYLHWLRIGAWSPRQELASIRGGNRRFFLTVTLSGRESGTALSHSKLEVQLLHGGKPVSTFTVDAPHGCTFGLHLPLHLLTDAGAPTQAFLDEVGSLRDYAERREAFMADQPWADQPPPSQYAFITDCAGFGTGAGRGVRTSDPETILAEFRTLRLMGVNAFRGFSAFMIEQIIAGEGLGKQFRRAAITHTIGYPINTISIGDGRPPFRNPGDGCPYYPPNQALIAERVHNAVEHLKEQARRLPVETLWALTVDEIGTIFDRTPEGKEHMGSCPHCREAFRDMIRQDGLTPADFGADSWDPIRATYGYWSIDFWESQKRLQDALTNAQAAVQEAARTTGSTLGQQAPPADDFTRDFLDDLTDAPKVKTPAELAAAVDAAKERYDALNWHSRILEVPEAERQLQVSEAGWHLLQYYSRRFNNLSAAGLFTALRDTAAAANANRPEGQARILTFALRGNTFLMRGHSLDFFEFYRLADNAMVYETSNRDPRVWQWDSYLCDVGRSLQRFYDKDFAVYVKPHRGAPVQRALAAIARGATMVYWYTYGPEWQKGDSFAPRLDLLERIGWASRLIAEAEPVTYGSTWALPAEVAIVRPATSEYFSGPASFEDGKWVYTALMHAHIPVDPLDERLLLTQDLSAYKVIVICGSHLERSVADKLAQWVRDGGTLITMGYGSAKDQAGRDLEQLWPIFGVTRREAPAQWGEVRGYGATRLSPITPITERPQGAAVTTSSPYPAGTFMPAVGREILHPTPEAEVMARYGDGSAAILRHRVGNGTAWLIGTWAGVEYSTDALNDEPYSALKRALLSVPVREAGVMPVVDASDPLVEGILVRHPDSGRLAVILINWRHQIDEPVTIRLRGCQEMTRARSTALAQQFDLRADGDTRIVQLPSMQQGDILLLE